MFSNFLLENEKQAYFTSIKHLEEIIFSLTLVFKLIYDEVHLQQVTELINKLPEYVQKNQEVILSENVISQKIYNKINNDNKNLKITFKLNILNKGETYLNNRDEIINYTKIKTFFDNIKNKCKIIKKIENNLIKLINKSYVKDDLLVAFQLFIDESAYRSLLNINFLNNKEIVHNIQILIRKNKIEIKESFFRFIFNFSHHFQLPLTDNIDKNLPKTYKEIQNFIYHYPDQFNNENSIIHYIKKYLEEKEKYYLKSNKTEKNKIIKERNEIEICQKTLDALYHFFIQKYSFVFDKSSHHFSNPQLIYFNSLFCEFLKKYVVDLDYYNVIISDSNIIELNDQLIDDIKRNNIILYKINKKMIEFYPLIKNSIVNNDSIFNNLKLVFELKINLNTYKSNKNIYIKLI